MPTVYNFWETQSPAALGSYLGLNVEQLYLYLYRRLLKVKYLLHYLSNSSIDDIKLSQTFSIPVTKASYFTQLWNTCIPSCDTVYSGKRSRIPRLQDRRVGRSLKGRGGYSHMGRVTEERLWPCLHPSSSFRAVCPTTLMIHVQYLWHTSTRQHGVTSQQTAIFIATAGRENLPGHIKYSQDCVWYSCKNFAWSAGPEQNCACNRHNFRIWRASLIYQFPN